VHSWVYFDAMIKECEGHEMFQYLVPKGSIPPVTRNESEKGASNFQVLRGMGTFTYYASSLWGGMKNLTVADVKNWGGGIPN
jgi:hypothetical protein